MLKIDIVVTKTEWTSVLEKFGRFDFCHTYDFHDISQKHGEGEPYLLVVRDERGYPILCWPMLRRAILDTKWFDFTSVYGYGGPLAREGCPIELAYQEIFRVLREMGGVTLFSRMHPLFMQQLTGDDLRGHYAGESVIIDTTQQAETLGSYRKDHRRGIKKAIKEGVEVIFDRECAKLELFINIYSTAMTDLGAAEYYCFNSDYFYNIANASDFDTILSFAEYEGKTIGAGMSLITNDIMQSYLGGTVAAYRKLAPMKLINEREHAFAIENNIEYLVLGGGVGAESDAVLDFKLGFSSYTLPFYVFKKVISTERYLEICRKMNVDPRLFGYFPPYRAQ